jgi:hypothetical protein
LWDKFESRIRGFEWRPYTNSWILLLVYIYTDEILEVNIPTLTEVLPSSSDALLPPPALLVMLMRLFVLGGLIIALTGLGGLPEGDPGGELAITLLIPSLRQNAEISNILYYVVEDEVREGRYAGERS